MGMTDDLIAFLKARLDEDEAAAKMATSGPWHLKKSPGWVASPVRDVAALDTVDAAHIARHDPDRALREVEAKRAIIACAFDLDGIMAYLAAVYSDHPDYRAEWKP